MQTRIRRMILESAYHAKHGHMPSALSIVEIMCAYDKIRSNSDEFILSKGHGCLAYYAYLVEKGLLSFDELKSFGKKGSRLGGHPDKNKVPEVYASTGSLGQGLPMALGVALARKITGKPGKIFCLVGDGECNEGTIWESLQIAVNLNLDNIVCIVDANNSQIRSLPTLNIANKFKAFGWNTTEIDGHDVDLLTISMSRQFTAGPMAIIANTIKGKGFRKLEEDMFAWHHRAPTDKDYLEFLQELK
jgi:transketolase